MDDNSKTCDEPMVLPISTFVRREPPPDHDPQPVAQQIETDPEVERFWAGRTFAMRRSARRAA
jgi:hypothetical protein